MYNMTLCLTYLIYEKYILNTTDSLLIKIGYSIAIKKMNYLKAFFLMSVAGTMPNHEKTFPKKV